MKHILLINIEQETIINNCYRRVIHTSQYSQLVLMSISPIDKEIGYEIHHNTDQFIRIEKGQGIAVIGKQSFIISNGTSISIPAGTYHNIINNSDKEDLKLYTIYSGEILHSHNELEIYKSQ